MEAGTKSLLRRLLINFMFTTKQLHEARFHNWIFKPLLQTDNEILVSEMKKMGVIDFFSEIKHVEKLACENQHGLQGF